MVSVITGDHCGLLKRVQVTDGIIAKWGELDRKQAVLCMDWLPLGEASAISAVTA